MRETNPELQYHSGQYKDGYRAAHDYLKLNDACAPVPDAPCPFRESRRRWNAGWDFVVYQAGRNDLIKMRNMCALVHPGSAPHPVLSC